MADPIRRSEAFERCIPPPRGLRTPYHESSASDRLPRKRRTRKRYPKGLYTCRGPEFGAAQVNYDQTRLKCRAQQRTRILLARHGRRFCRAQRNAKHRKWLISRNLQVESKEIASMQKTWNETVDDGVYTSDGLHVEPELKASTHAVMPALRRRKHEQELPP